MGITPLSGLMMWLDFQVPGIFVSGSGVRSIWVRNGVESFKKRLRALETKVVAEGILLTDSQAAALERKKLDVRPAEKLKNITLVILVLKTPFMWAISKA
jgi:hypothetical protein